MASTKSAPAGDEKNFLGRELPYRALYVAVAAVLITCVVFAFLLLPLVFGFSSWSESAGEAARTIPAPSPERPQGPLLQAKPEDQLIDYDRQIEAELKSYAWVDESAGVVQVPIERAREMILAEGLGGAMASAEEATQE